jgi:hypothetical protein
MRFLYVINLLFNVCNVMAFTAFERLSDSIPANKYHFLAWAGYETSEIVNVGSWCLTVAVIFSLSHSMVEVSLGKIKSKIFLIDDR